MRTLHFERVGGTVSAVVSTRASVPRVTGSDVLVKVAASSINGSDIGLRHSRGLAALVTKRSRPGFDIAGRIVDCGNQVTAFEIGDRVAGLLGHGGGGQADYVVVPQRRLALIPATMSPVQAAAVPLAGLTALQALRARGRMRTGDDTRALINGAAGGIGSFAVQLAKMLGAHVTAVSGTERHDYLAGLGADETIDRDDPALLSGALTFDVIFDTPGAWRMADVRSALRRGGVLVTTHPISTDLIKTIRPPWQSSSPRAAAVTTSASSQDLSYLLGLVRDQRLAVPIDRTFPLAEAQTAYEYAEGGSIRGKVVLTL